MRVHTYPVYSVLYFYIGMRTFQYPIYHEFTNEIYNKSRSLVRIYNMYCAYKWVCTTETLRPNPKSICKYVAYNRLPILGVFTDKI